MGNLKSTINRPILTKGVFTWVLTVLTFIFVLNPSIFAQSPQAFNYQAVVRNNAGELTANQPVSLRISIRSGTAGGTILYQESHQVTTNVAGLINLLIGSGTPTSGSFTSIAWASGTMFLQVEIDATGGNNYVNMGTTQIVSVPYALYAPPDNDWTISGTKQYSAVSGNVGIGTTNPSYKLHVEASDANPILYVRNNGGGRGIRVNTQSSCALWVENSGNHGLRVTHANGNGVNITAAHGNGIHVEQADGWAGYFVGTGYFSGNVGIGNLTPAAKLHVNGNIISNDPIDPNHVATKQYVDQQLAKYVDEIEELEKAVQTLIEINESQKQQIHKLQGSL